MEKVSAEMKRHSISLGKRMREARKERKISLEQLAKGTQLSLSFLSQVETGKVNVSVDNIRKIADYLGVKMVRFFDPEDGMPDLGLVTRKGEGRPLEIEGTAAYCESLIPKGNLGLQSTLYINPPGEGRTKPASHMGEEFVYVLTGEVIFHLGDQEYHLHEGDSMFYRSETPHSWINPGKWQAVFIIVNTPQSW